jgi:hypothetical protein
MILLWGIAGDGPMDLVRRALERRGAGAVFLDQQEILQDEIELTVEEHARGRLRVGKRDLDLEEIRAVYVRPYETRCLAPMEKAGEGSPEWKRGLQFEGALACWSELTEAFVVNRLSAMGTNGSKPYQASLIRSCGFDVPETLVTTDREAAEDFWERHGSVIYKSVSGVRSIVSRLTPGHRERLADIAHCPTQFQEYVEGKDVRVHRVGEEVFGCEIESTADDYRYGSRQGREARLRAWEVPPDLAGRCRRMADSLRLPVAGIDLRRRANGDWCCFEVNPSPGFSYYENATGHPIGEAVAGLLMENGR